MSITFSSCFYIIKSKFDPGTYINWMNNFISMVNNFNLVIYTDENSSQYIDTKGNTKIKIIIKPFEKFYNYKYKQHWIENHKKNIFTNSWSSWELNMLWSEKIWFVKETIERKYFESDFYGWCDIGYFRNRQNDLHSNNLLNWPNNKTIMNLDRNKICYGCVNNDDSFMNFLNQIVNNKNQHGLPSEEIPASQNSISGGFFIIHKDKLKWWSETYNKKLELYFNYNYLVKDDQIILVDCIFSNLNDFTIFREYDPAFDNWFMFQRILF
jgi:hypothetical protein